jgi:hypothetical protein
MSEKVTLSDEQRTALDHAIKVLQFSGWTDEATTLHALLAASSPECGSGEAVSRKARPDWLDGFMHGLLAVHRRIENYRHLRTMASANEAISALDKIIMHDFDGAADEWAKADKKRAAPAQPEQHRALSDETIENIWMTYYQFDDREHAIKFARALLATPACSKVGELDPHDALRYMACRESAVERGLFATPEEYDAMVDDSLRKKGKEVLTGRGNNYGKKVAKDGSLYRPPAQPAQDSIFSPFNACMFRDECRARASASPVSGAVQYELPSDLDARMNVALEHFDITNEEGVKNFTVFMLREVLVEIERLDRDAAKGGSGAE